jgi:transcriptional regulator with XRE-family HTH domain
MNLQVMSDQDIVKELGLRLDAIRKHKNLRDIDVTELAGLGDKALSRFRRGANPSLETFMKLMRALDELDQLDGLLQLPSYSPVAALKQPAPRQRVRTKTPKNTQPIKWGDEL